MSKRKEVDPHVKELWEEYKEGDKSRKSEIASMLRLSKYNIKRMSRYPSSSRTLKIINKQVNEIKKQIKKRITVTVKQYAYNTNKNQNNFPLDDTPKSDIWHISGIQTETKMKNVLSKHYSEGYIQKVEKLFAETILSTSRDIRTYHRFVNNLYDLLLSDLILSLLDVLKKIGQGSLHLGGTNLRLNQELAFDSTDTQHDFKPVRNKIYPYNIEGQGANKHSGSIVYEKLNAVIGTTPQFGDTYITNGNYIDFEENIKVDYLLGDLVGPLEDIYYYFTDINSYPPKWSIRRRNFFGIQGGNVKVNSINSLARDVKKRLYDGWVLDACVSGRVSRSLGERKKTLANIWDPVGGIFKKDELLEFNNSNKLEMREIVLSRTSLYKIYDCIIIESGSSLYDTVYNSLLNTGFENLKIQLRLLVNNNNNECKVAIFIITGKKSTLFIANKFSVRELAEGLRYIDDKNNKNRKQKYDRPIDDTLKAIIDHMDHELHMLGVNDDERSRIIQKMLYRFKSSGDHGTSDTVKVLNSIGLNHLFLSGDALAYVYAISSIGTTSSTGKSLPTPTIATYYRENKIKTEDDEDEEEDDDVMDTNDGEIDGNHFIVAYFPAGDDVKKNIIKLLENLNALYGLAKVLNLKVDSIELDSNETLSIQDLYYDISPANKDLLLYIRGQQSLVFDPTTITIQFNEQVKTQLSAFIRRYPIWISMGKLDSVDEFMKKLSIPPLEAFEFTKTTIYEVNGFVNKLFFMHKYSDIVRLNNEMIQSDREAFEPIVSLDQSSSSGRARRSITTRLSSVYVAVKNSLIKNIKGLRNTAQLQKSDIEQALSNTFVTERKTEYDRINGIKATLSNNSKSLFKRLKDKLGFTEPFVTAMKNEILTMNNPSIQQLRDDITTNAGGDEFAKTLVTLFDKELNAKISATSADVLKTPPQITPPQITPPQITPESQNAFDGLLTMPINTEKKTIIEKIREAKSRVSNAINSLRRGGGHGIKSIRCINSRKNKHHIKKLKCLRKTRKNELSK